MIVIVTDIAFLTADYCGWNSSVKMIIGIIGSAGVMTGRVRIFFIFIVYSLSLFSDDRTHDSKREAKDPELVLLVLKVFRCNGCGFIVGLKQLNIPLSLNLFEFLSLLIGKGFGIGTDTIDRDEQLW
mmetsp:Transcript_21639/g.39712  ORF Transcript_21639/g.39712 Transcript_21639/m.39712 type:complete len:127 (+) Transcript_21639:289-669(+)